MCIMGPFTAEIRYTLCRIRCCCEYSVRKGWYSRAFFIYRIGITGFSVRRNVTAKEHTAVTHPYRKCEVVLSVAPHDVQDAGILLIMLERKQRKLVTVIKARES